VKVKAFDIYPKPYNEPYAEDVEKVLQAWLNDNPDARIECVAQTAMLDMASSRVRHRLIVTVFYRD
jgi:hypothetical protein